MTALASGVASVATGVNAKAEGEGAVAVGGASTASSKGAVALGLSSNALKINSTALGKGATANAQEGDVALGQGSSTAIVNNSGIYKLNSTKATTSAPNGTLAAARTPNSVVSVGSVGNERRITNVAAANISATSTDAVNGSQLFITSTALNESAAATQAALGGGAVINPVTGVYTAPSYTLTNNPNGGTGSTTTSDNVGSALSTLDTAVNRSITVAGNTGTIAQKLGSTFNISGGATAASSNANVKTVVTGNTVDVQLVNAPTFTGKVSAQGFDAGSQKITNVAKGTNPNDAVNFSQLAETELTSSVKAGNNTTVTSATTGNNTEYTVNAEKSTISQGDGITVTKGDTTNNTTDYNVKLSAATKTSLGKADSAVQTVTSNDPNLTAVKTGNNVVFDFADAPTFTGQVKAVGFDASNAKIVNVLAGTKGTDAANVAQVKAAKTKVAAGTNVTTVAETTGDNGESVYTVNADKSTVSKGSDAVTVTAGDKDGSNVTDYQVDLSAATKTSLGKADSAVQTVTSNDPNLTAVKTGNNVVFDFANAPTFTGQVKAAGFDASNAKIVNVLAGTAATDAANVGQVQDAANAATNKAPVVYTTANGTQVYNTATGFNTAQDGTGTAVAASDIITSVRNANGSTTTATKLSNVAAGTIAAASTDAVNGSQINAITQGNKALLGGAKSVIDPVTGVVTSTDIGGTGATTIDGAISAANTQANKSLTFAGDKGDNVERKLGETLTVTGGADTDKLSDGNIGVVTNDADALTVKLSRTLKGLTSAEYVDATDTNKVTTTTASGTNVTDGDNTSNYGATGSTVTDKDGNSTTTTAAGVIIADNDPNTDNVTLTQNGLNNGGNTITNVKAGTAATDAANVGQVQDAANAATNKAPVVYTQADGTQVYSTATGFNTAQDGTGTAVAPADIITSVRSADGSTTSPTKLSNVAAGTISAVSKDAVNGSQINAITQGNKALLGGDNSVIDPVTGVVTSTNIGGTGATTIDGAISAANTQANKSLTFTGDAGDNVKRKLGETLTVTGGVTDTTKLTDNNIGVVTNDTDTLTVKLNKDINLGATGSVTTGNTVTNNAGVTIDDKDGNVTKLTTAGTQVKDNQGNATNYGAKGLTFLDKNGAPITNAPSITKAGISAGNQKITNVAPGNVAAGSTDAINGDQLNTTNQSIAAAQGQIDDGINFGDGVTSENYKLGDTINVKGDSNVTSVTTKDGVQLGLADKISVQQVTVGDATNSTVLTSTTNGLDVGGDKITNVADGTTAKDAVNKGQLDALATAGSTKTDALGNSTASNLGGGAQYDASTGAVSAPTYSVNGKNSNNVGDAISALDQGFTLQTNGKNAAAVKAGDTIDIGTADAENNLEVVKSANTIKYSLKKNLDLGTAGSVTTGNTVTNNAGVTVDDKTGNITQITAAGTKVTDGANTTNYGAEGLTFLDTNGAPITNAPSITKAGISAGNQKITNVAPGNVAAGSTDAINGDQLNTTNQSIAAAQGQIDDGINFGDGATSQNYKLGDTINVKGDSNVTSITTNDGVQLGLADKISVQQVTVGDATNSTVLTSTTNGLDVGGDKITNVADGTTAKDAVNKGQLDALATAGSTKTDALGNSTASNLGGGATYDDKTGTVSAPTYKVNGNDSNNVGDAISALDQGFTLKTNGADAAAVKAGDTIDIGTADAENNLEVVKSANTIKYSLKKNLDLGTAGSVTTGNTVTNNAGVTVDDGESNVTALTKAGTNVTDGTNTSNYGATGSTITDGTNTTNTTAQGTTVTDGTNTTSYGAEGLTFLDSKTGTALAGTPSITKAGISAGNTVIKNVAAGNVAKDSTDAINGNQLFETNQAIANAQGQANKGFNIAADNGTPDNVQLGETVKYTNKDSNLVATVSDNGINYDLADDINVKSVTADDGKGNVTKLDSTGTKVKDAAGNNSSYNAMGSTIIDTKGNTNASTAVGNTLKDDAGNETITAADGTNVKDAIGNASNYGAAGSKITDADGNETTTAANGTKVKDINGNESVYGAAGTTITDNAGNTNVSKATGNTIVDTAGNQTMTAASGMTVQDGKGNATSYGAEGLTFINTTTGEAIANTPSITKGGINAGNTVIRNVASGLEGKTVEQIKAEGSTSAQWKNAATVGDLTQVQGNVTNVTNNVTNISQILGQSDGFVDSEGNLTAEGEEALKTYNVSGQTLSKNNSVINAINKINKEGIRFFHSNDGEERTQLPTDGGKNSVDSSAGGAYSTAIGYQAKVGNQATNGIAIGKGATVTGKDSIAIGTGNIVNGNGSGAFGDPSIIDGNNSYSVGNDNKLATDKTFVLGNNVTKTAENSVNLGSESAAYTEASSSTAGTTVYNQSKINGETYNYAGGTAAGVVSVGDVDAERRIQNVAAGLISKDSTDAINGSQLYGTNQAIEALKTNIGTTTDNVSKGVNFGNGSTAKNYQLGDTINVKGDKNVTSTTITGGVQLGLADNITVKSVAAQTVTADDDKGNSATLTVNGTNVKDAAGNTSNYGAAGTTVADKEGNKATTAANGVTVSNAKNSTVYGADGMTFVDNNGTAITKAPSVTVQGINAGNQQITNVAEGKITEGSNDAVNGGQLYNTNQAITKVANSVDDLGYKLDGVQEEANAGISSAMAMASMPQAFLPGKSMISGGIATYNGEGAVAVGMSKLSDNGRWVIKINGSADTKGNAGAAAGVGMHW